MITDVPRPVKLDASAETALDAVAAIDPGAKVTLDEITSYLTGKTVAVDFSLCYTNPRTGAIKAPFHSITIDGLNADTERAAWKAAIRYYRNAADRLEALIRELHPTGPTERS